jgi:hypothetical protein
MCVCAGLCVGQNTCTRQWDLGYAGMFWEFLYRFVSLYYTAYITTITQPQELKENLWSLSSARMEFFCYTRKNEIKTNYIKVILE